MSPSFTSADARPACRRRRFQPAFTLVEILVSLAVLAILLLISAQVIGTVQSTWTTSNARISQFREARTAFDIITRNLSQASLNTYLDYNDSYLQSGATAAVNTAPTNYVRKADLRFLCGPAEDLLVTGGDESQLPGHAIFFQAPLGVAHDPAYAGLDRLLCARGYFVQFTSDEFFRPAWLPSSEPRYRYRLMEFSPPAERNLIYSNTNTDWYSAAGVPLDTSESATNRGLTRPIADNILALVISPMLETDPTSGVTPTSIAPSFRYDSRPASETGGTGQEATKHLLPPLVRVVLVAIDERSAERLSFGSASEPPFGAEISSLITTGDADQLNVTLEEVARRLRDRRVNYRIFSSTVVLRGAKWGI